MPETEILAKKLINPEGFWRLLDDTVFQFNDLYRRFWRNGLLSFENSLDGSDTDDALVVPIMFDKQSRTFNWIALADSILGDCSDVNEEDLARCRSDRLVKIIAGLAASFSVDEEKHEQLQWSEFTRLFSDSPHCETAISNVTKEIEEYKSNRRIYRHKIEGDKSRIDELYFSLSMLYSAYSHPKNHSLEGCFFTALERFGNLSPDYVNHTIFGRVRHSIIDLNQWIMARNIPAEKWMFENWDGDERRTIFWDREECGYTDDRQQLSSVVHDNFLNNLFMSWPINNLSKSKTLSELLNDKDFLVIVPIYDAWVGSSGFGGLQAVLLVLMESPKEGETKSPLVGKKSWEDTYQHKLLPRCEGFAQGLSATAIRRAIATPIAPPYDLVTHFLKILSEVQDWDEAVVYRNGIPSYQYKRISSRTADGRIRVRIPWMLSESFNPADIVGPHEPSGGLVSTDRRFYMWWTCRDAIATKTTKAHYDLWSDYFLSELSEELRLSFQDVSIRFKFPKACRIPPANEPSSQDYLVETYRRQQLELMRALIPNVRARRAALRNAVSAIMGRNMSHNIGSHVLARYAAGIAQHEPNGDLPDPRTDFLSYLQRRMDFLAEVATADQSFWTQPLALRDQLERLNYKAQCEKFYGPGAVLDHQNRYPPLLKFITGKDNLRANVEFAAFHGCSNEAINRLPFSCPGGEVGVHALYVILENVIRNSARHNEEVGGKVEVEVRAKDRSFQEDESVISFPKTKWEGLIELHVLDYRTKLRRDGLPFSSDKELGEAWEWTEKLQAEKDDKGKRIKLDVIPDDINCILQNEPILEDDGTPSPHYWGLREMQICAQYLRQLRLSDLEDVSYAGRDAVAGKVPLIRAECAKYGEGDHDYCLSYVFYVHEAALLATIEQAPDEEGTNFAVVHEAPGLAKLKLAHEDIERIGEPQASSAFGKALRELQNYAFVAYSSEVADWVKAHRGKLPVRLLELPSDAPHGTSTLTLPKAQHLFEAADGEPLAKMEELHAVHAKNLHGDDAVLAGIVLGNNEAVSQFFEGEIANTPIDIRCVPNGGQLSRPWSDWWKRACIGKDGQFQRLHACVWLDHPGDPTFEAIQDLVQRNQRTQITLIASEPCFTNSPASEAIRTLKPGQGWELLAASLLRIAVLDERVQAAAGEIVRKGLSIETCWKGMQVFVPVSCRPPGDDPRDRLEEVQFARADLDQPDIDACRAFLVSLSNPMDFLVVHLTILERFSAANKIGIRACVDKLVDGTKASDAQVVIVTGRGVPTFARSLEDDESQSETSGRVRHFRFLPISALLEYLVQRPSKLGLMRVLWSASSPQRRS